VRSDSGATARSRSIDAECGASGSSRSISPLRFCDLRAAPTPAWWSVASRPAAISSSVQNVAMSGVRSRGSTASARANTCSTSFDTIAPYVRGVGRRRGSSVCRRIVSRSPSITGLPAIASAMVIASPHTSVNGPLCP
jgi:hypothetical protein